MAREKPLRVWIGFVDGRPYVEDFTDEYGDARGIDAFTSRAQARKRFGDARPMLLVPAAPRPGTGA